ncbi:30S ribosomal protein S5 [Chlamydia sp. 17-3921]|uniref:30S ribosomal protein S5 n=1 Tax=Chlamydia sp. 17-3921 TaxID=2675798 RepID=UPI001919241D|nr:30S ribosomal protein S5 [Chlamydia sp. 17-3921]
MSLSKNSHKEDQLEEKVLVVNRCSKVVKGGRKFSFSALILVGDGKGRLGYGFAKANELTDAIRKGGEAARKNLIEILALENGSIPHEVFVHHDGAQLLLKPAKLGTGIVAGSRIRLILEMAGIKDIVAKSLGSNNPMNQVKAAFKALTELSIRKEVLRRRRAHK